MKDNNNLTDQPTAEQNPSDETPSGLRDISDEELKQILEDHKKWLESDGKEGERADLRNTNLQGVNLTRANLRSVNLYSAILNKAKLNYANFYNANMSKCKGLDDAELQYANLEGAVGLLGTEFSGNDLTGVKLPASIRDFKSLSIVEEISKNARKILFLMTVFCGYSLAVIASTTDLQILTNSVSEPLPVINIQNPTVWLFIIGPYILIGLYLYFHIYVRRIWEALGKLPAKLPDGRRLDEWVYPWVLNSLVGRQMNLIRRGRPILAHVEEIFSIFIAWWVVPITIVFFWLRFLPRHDWFITFLHIVLLLISLIFGAFFYRLCSSVLQGKEKAVFRFITFWKDRRFFNGLSITIVGIVLSLVSFGSIEGVRPEYDPTKQKKIDFYKIKVLVPWAFNQLGYSVFADFSEKSVSERPLNYWEIAKEDRSDSVRGANLRGRNLNNANMYRAFMVKADLRMTTLKNADLFDANLEKANLTGANLHQADLREANLQQANFREANLQLANLEDANLQKADLEKTNIEEANLDGAYLLNAVLLGANLTGAKNLTIAQLSQAKTLYKAKLDPELLEQVKECCPHLLEKPKEETDQTK
jgi:uncharacterized protein YjbI with pentapeptide repeats